MTFNRITRKWYLFIISGFFIACTTEGHLKEAYKKTDNEDYGAAIQSVNKAIENNPDNTRAHYLRAYIYYAQARTLEPVLNRYSLYQQMKLTAQTGLNVIAGDSSISVIKFKNDVDDLLSAAWRTEYNSAEQLWNSLTNEPDQVTRVIAHGRNARVIAPDSALTYLVLANAYTKTRQYKKAYEALQFYLSLNASQEKTYPDETGFLLAKSGRPDRAHPLLLTGNDSTLGTAKLITLINSYIKTGNHNQSIRLLTELNRLGPAPVSQSQLPLVLTEQYYFYFNQLTDSLNVFKYNYRESEESIELSKNDIQTLLAVSDSTLAYTAQVDTQKTGLPVIQKLAFIHQNMGAWYKQLSDQSNTFTPLIVPYKNSHLRQASFFYRLQADSIRDKQTYWDQLYQIYSSLGDTARAREAFIKSSFNPRK